MAAWVLLGLGAAAAVTAAVAGTAGRNNRFLAGGVVALDVIAAGVVGALLGPALARVLGPLARLRRDWRAPQAMVHQPPSTPAGLLVLAPACALVVAGLVFVVVWRMRGNTPTLRGVRAALAGGLTAIVPFALALAAAQARKVRLRAAALVAAIGFGVPALSVRGANWTKHLQFVPWRDIRLLALIVAAGAGAGVRAAGAGAARAEVAGHPAGRAAGGAGHRPVGGRARGGAQGRRQRGGGGRARCCGWCARRWTSTTTVIPGCWAGAIATTGTTRINPGAQDWPEDGIDQDCDSRRSARRRPAAAADARGAGQRARRPQRPAGGDRHPAGRPAGRPTATSGPPRPQLDRLARDGVVFENAWAHAPSTRYSMPAIMTGRWPSAIKWDMSIWWPGIARDQPTIAEVLRNAGLFQRRVLRLQLLQSHRGPRVRAGHRSVRRSPGRQTRRQERQPGRIDRVSRPARWPTTASIFCGPTGIRSSSSPCIFTIPT